MTDIQAAIILATQGRKFTEIEKLLNIYYRVQMDVEKIRSGNKTASQEVMEGEQIWTEEFVQAHNSYIQQYAKDLTSNLCKIFIEAVNAGDSAKLSEIGKAMEFLKTFKQSGDRFRADILSFKSILDKTEEKWPIRRLAKAIGWPDMESQDGFSRLRRLCVELRFPLAASRQITRK